MSPLEQTGFEPPVPLAKARVIFGEEKGPEVISVVSKDVVFFPGGPVVRIPFALPASQQPIEAANELTAYPASEFTRLFSRSPPGRQANRAHSASLAAMMARRCCRPADGSAVTN